MTPAQEVRGLLGEEAERRDFLEELRARLTPAQCQRIARLFERVAWLLNLLDCKNLSIAKLRQLCFGASTERARDKSGKPAADLSQRKSKRKGHGRNGHRCYTGARRIRVPHPTLRPGQTCPGCQRGKLRPRKQPAIAMAIQAQPPLSALIHEMEQLRCDACGKLFTAPTPATAGAEKYAPSVGVLVGLMRYGSGMPFYRLERLQQSLGVPLPASVQWEQVERVARPLQPIWDHLIDRAAQSELLFSDDTSMRVGQLRQQIQAQSQPQRTGIFTSGIIGQIDGHCVTFFFTGRTHAGENLAALLDQRRPEHGPPLHMCDGLARNAPKGHATRDCSCNVHARRNFVELQGLFPEACRKVIDCYSEIYRLEAKAKADQLSPEQRLQAHQTHSQPLLEELQTWFQQQLQERHVEPNSALGQAIAYMQNRWNELTQFLRVPGAPLDNNAAERVLKMAILHRKNSLFYKTQRGAQVGDLFMSLIQTCRANQINPFDYLLAVVTNAQAVQAAPQSWLPWNYPPASAQPSRPDG